MADSVFNLGRHKITVTITPHVKRRSRGKIVYDARASCPIKSCPKSAMGSFASYQADTADSASREVANKLRIHYSRAHG